MSFSHLAATRQPLESRSQTTRQSPRIKVSSDKRARSNQGLKRQENPLESRSQATRQSPRIKVSSDKRAPSNQGLKMSNTLKTTDYVTFFRGLIQVLQKGNSRDNSTSNNNYICYICGEKGHCVNACTKKGTSVQNECYNCGETGHWIRDCKAEKRTRTIPFGQCFICKSTEHWAKQCPQKLNPTSSTSMEPTTKEDDDESPTPILVVEEPEKPRKKKQKRDMK